MQRTKQSERILNEVSQGAHGRPQYEKEKKRVDTSESSRFRLQTSNLSTHYSKSIRSATQRSLSRESRAFLRAKQGIPPLQTSLIQDNSLEGDNNTNNKQLFSLTSRDTSRQGPRHKPALDQTVNSFKSSNRTPPAIHTITSLDSIKMPHSIAASKSQNNISKDTIRVNKGVLKIRIPPVVAARNTCHVQNQSHNESMLRQASSLTDRAHHAGEASTLSTYQVLSSFHKEGMEKTFNVERFIRNSLKTFKPIVRAESNTRVKTTHAKQLLIALNSQFRLIRESMARKEIEDRQKFMKISKEAYQKECHERQELKLNKMKEAMPEIALRTILAFQATQSRSYLDAIIAEIIEIGRNSESFELHLYCLKIAGKVALVRKDLVKAQPFFRQIKTLCDAHKFDFIETDNDEDEVCSKSRADEKRVLMLKAQAYKNLGVCEQECQNYKKALAYFIKMLQLAWHCKNHDYELLAYDMIGLQNYYLGEIEKATYFHHRMVTGRVEEEGSNLKQLGISRVAVYSHASKKRRKAEDTITSSGLSFNNQSSDEEVELPLPKDFEHVTNDLKANMRANQSKFNLTKSKKLRSTDAKNPKIDLKRIFSPKEAYDEKALMEKPSNIVKTVGKNNYQKLQQKICLSHLSPNRGLGNFANLHLSHLIAESTSGEDHIDARTATNLYLILEKFKKNIEMTQTILNQIAEDPLEYRFKHKELPVETATMIHSKSSYGGFYSSTRKF